MNHWARAVVAGAVLLTGACGMFDDEEEPLPGQRIPVREYRNAVTAPPAPPAPPALEVQDPEQQAVQ